MEKHWICSNCGSVNPYPDTLECEVCGSKITRDAIDELFKKDTTVEEPKKEVKNKHHNSSFMAICMILVLIIGFVCGVAVSGISSKNSNSVNPTKSPLPTKVENTTAPRKKYDKIDLKKIILEDSKGDTVTFDADATLGEIAQKCKIDDELQVFIENDNGGIGYSYNFDAGNGFSMSRFDSVEEWFIAIGRIYLENSYFDFQIEGNSIENDGKIFSDYCISLELSDILNDIFDYDDFSLNGINISDSKEYVESLWGQPDETNGDGHYWHYSIVDVDSDTPIAYYNIVFDDNDQVTDIRYNGCNTRIFA